MEPQIKAPIGVTPGASSAVSLIVTARNVTVTKYK